jgi:glucosamine-6-phosphate deaminase
MIAAVRERPCLVVGLPTGETPVEMYRELVAASFRGEVDFSRITAFSIDEYLGLEEGHPTSFATYMREHLWKHVNANSMGVHIPSSCPSDPNRECERYEAAIRDAGGLDLTILGIGVNGHIGFNEPGTPWDSATHVASLTDETRLRNATSDQQNAGMPTTAITMGIKTILSSRTVILLASGTEKAGILKQALLGATTVDRPASALRTHRALTVLCDEAAAAELVPALETHASSDVERMEPSALEQLVVSAHSPLTCRS